MFYLRNTKPTCEKDYLDQWHEHPAHGGDLAEGVIVDRLSGY
jgi:hypothetical protein